MFHIKRLVNHFIMRVTNPSTVSKSMTARKLHSEAAAQNEVEENSNEVCGIVMPISSIDGCSESHWNDVLGIHTEAIESVKLDANLVSSADDVGIIQKRILQNLYSNPIVVCDVSGKNPNVMLELGMRLAFDKPVVIVKDDKTSYSFDTSPIEHLTYPRDLRFSKIVEFKKELRSKILKTLEASKRDKNFSPFLQHFGQFKVAKIDTTEVSSDEYILDELRSLRSQISGMSSKNQSDFNFLSELKKDHSDGVINIKKTDGPINLDELVGILLECEEIELGHISERAPNNFIAHINILENGNLKQLERSILKAIGRGTVEFGPF